MKRLTESQITEIIALYQQGATPKEIGAKFGIFNNSVTRLLKKRGIERNQLKRVDNVDIQQIIEKYQSGISSEIIGQELNLNGTSVCRILRRNGVKIRSSEKNKRCYKINQRYFQNIDSEEKAYFLGMLFADANVSKHETHRWSIKLSLQVEDREIVEKFSQVIYGFCKIDSSFGQRQDGTIHEYCAVSIYSKFMCLDLDRLGCVPRKSLIIKFPHFLGDKLLRHFIRGYFDGDGCLSLSNENKPVIDITSSTFFIEGIVNYLSLHLNMKMNKIGHRHKDNLKTANIQITANDKIQKFLDYIYDDATIFMKRKKDIYYNFISLMKEKRDRKLKKTLNISKYGTTYIPEFEGNRLTSTYLMKASEIDKHNIAGFIFDFYRQNGFPYPTIDDNTIIRDFNTLKKSTFIEGKIFTIFNTSGSSIVKHFSPHFYNVQSGIESNKLSVFDAFHNDRKLLQTINNRLQQNYTISGNMLRQGLVNSHSAFKASIFNPNIAKQIYHIFTQPNDIVYDYSMGFGHRLLGALSIPHKLTYIGVDPLQKSVQSNINIFDYFNKNVPFLNKEAIILNNGSENFCDAQFHGQVALAFSSPPYFNQEIYEMNENQAYYNKSYNQFINEWWRQTVSNINILLKTDGVFIINIKDNIDGFNLSNDMLNVAKEQGFNLVDTFYIQLSKNLVFKNKNQVMKYEPIYILKRA